MAEIQTISQMEQLGKSKEGSVYNSELSVDTIGKMTQN